METAVSKKGCLGLHYQTSNTKIYTNNNNKKHNIENRISLQQAFYDAEHGINLSIPFNTAKEAITAMLEE